MYCYIPPPPNRLSSPCKHSNSHSFVSSSHQETLTHASQPGCSPLLPLFAAAAAAAAALHTHLHLLLASSAPAPAPPQTAPRVAAKRERERELPCRTQQVPLRNSSCTSSSRHRLRIPRLRFCAASSRHHSNHHHDKEHTQQDDVRRQIFTSFY